MIALERPGWKTAANWICAVLLAILFLASGLWKITDSQGAAMRMAQAKVPESLSLAAALLFGIVETATGVFLLAPRLRRWGGAIAGILLIVFMAYFALEYNALRGGDCSCFPWIKRIVGPGFFIGDTLMLSLAVFAALWTRPPGSIRSAILVLGAVTVFALVTFGVGEASQTGIRAPDTVMVAGQPYALQRGKVFVFFFDPECLHCLAAAKSMAKLQWGDTRVLTVPVEHPEWAAGFLSDAGLQAAVTSDFETLKQVFHYSTYPFAVAIENGRQKAALTKFDGGEPAATIRKLGFAE